MQVRFLLSPQRVFASSPEVVLIPEKMPRCKSIVFLTLKILIASESLWGKALVLGVQQKLVKTDYLFTTSRPFGWNDFN
jgi:hypothetical protein